MNNSSSSKWYLGHTNFLNLKLSKNNIQNLSYLKIMSTSWAKILSKIKIMKDF